MIRNFISLYLPSYPKVLVYMLQSSEYHVGPYLKWVARTKDFSRVMQRPHAEATTKPARLLLLALRLGILLQIAAWPACLCIWGIWHNLAGGVELGIALIIAYPFVWAYLAVVPLLMGRELSTRPKEQRMISRSEAIFASTRVSKSPWPAVMARPP